MAEVYLPLKMFADMTSADAWSISGGSGSIDSGDIPTTTQSVSLRYICLKKDITPEVLAYYQTTTSFAAADIKACMVPATLWTFADGTWNNGGLSWSESGKALAFTLNLQLKV